MEWQPCRSPVLVFCSSRAIYLGFSLCPLWGKLIFLSPSQNYFKMALGMALLYILTYLGGITFSSICGPLSSTGKVVEWWNSGCIENCIYCVSVNVSVSIMYKTDSDLNHSECIGLFGTRSIQDQSLTLSNKIESRKRNANILLNFSKPFPKFF